MTPQKLINTNALRETSD